MHSTAVKDMQKSLKMSDEVQERMLVSEDGRSVSEHEYWEYYYEHSDFNYEWNNGILEEVPVSDYLNISMYRWFVKLIEFYCEKHRSVKMVNIEFGYRLALPHKVTIRKPDIGIKVKDNPIDLKDDDRSYKGVFDVCVELISDASNRDIMRDTVYKKEEYENIGVREYYIFDARNTYMAFYRRNRHGFFEHIQPNEKDIIQSEVMKGFQFRISDLFRQPLTEDLTSDEVYQDYVFPQHNRVKQEAEEAKKQAHEEKKRADDALKMAEEEKKRADFLAAKLESLGISVDDL